MRLKEALALPERKSEYVRTLFPRIAHRYDVITVLLSYGLDRRWKRRLADLADLGQGLRLLDLATGTGDLAFLASDRSRFVVGLDITARMLDLAAAKRPTSHRFVEAGCNGGRSAIFVRGDMLELPFRSESFDIVTTGYGLRNVPDLGRALDEITRVLRPRGRFLSLEFDRPANSLVRMLYLGYLTLVGSTLGWLFHRDANAYRYIAASLHHYPGSGQVAAMLRVRGFRCEVIPVLGSLMAIHRAWKLA
jgi:demethylmenaquinone methyltransferase/2-methoxy-6-polyprenyl-1,4-benzoquinol methylase